MKGQRQDLLVLQAKRQNGEYYLDVSFTKEKTKSYNILDRIQNLIMIIEYSFALFLLAISLVIQGG